MKFRVDTKLFEEKLGLIQGVAEKRATMPILSHVLISTTENKVIIIATDLETTMRLSLDAKVEKVSSITVPSRKLFEIIKELPEGEIEIQEIENNWVELQTASAKFKLAGLPADDFPALPDISTNNLLEIESKVIDDMISKTIFSVSPDELRRNLSGIYFENTGEKSLRLVATDGHRLSYIDHQSDHKIGLEKNFLVPKKAVSELRKLLRFSEKISIGCENNFFVSKVDDITIYSRLIDADFPDYKQVTPDSTKTTFKVNTVYFLSALKRVSVFSSEKTRSIKVEVSKNSLNLISVAPEVGEAKESIVIEYHGEDIEIGFNSRYLMDVLEAVDEPVVVVGLSDELSPVMIVPETGKDYVNVIMPMRV